MHVAPTEPPRLQSLLAWDADVLIVDPPRDWDERGVASTYRHLPLGSRGYRRDRVRIEPLTPRSPFMRLVVPAHLDIAEEQRIIPAVDSSYLASLELLWALRAALLGEPVPRPLRGWRRRVRRRRTGPRPNEGPFRDASPPSKRRERVPPGPWIGVRESSVRLAALAPAYVVDDARRVRVVGDRLVVERRGDVRSVPLSTLTCQVQLVETESRTVVWTDLHFGPRCALRVWDLPPALEALLPSRRTAVEWSTWSGTALRSFEVRDVR